MTTGNAALAIMAGAYANTSEQGLLDAALINNKIRVASNFTFALDIPVEVQAYSGAAAASTVRSMLSTLSSSTDSAAFQSTVTSTISSLVNSSSQISRYQIGTNQIDADQDIHLIGSMEHGTGYQLFA
jgi:hypothetical protein